jgi:hypothetical protein
MATAQTSAARKTLALFAIPRMIILHLIDPCLAVYWLEAPGTAARSPIHAAVSDLRLDEGEQVGIDDVRMRRRHPVGKSLVNLERGILDQFGLQQ